MSSRVVIIIPTYNEKGNVGDVTRSLAKVFRGLAKYNPSILFVDDNSPDGTAGEITKLIRTYPFVHLLKNKQKGGLGHAYKKGMRYAIDKLSAEVVFEFDADLSHDPAVIPAMLQKIDEGSDLVLGSRYIKGGGIPPKWGIHRKFLSVVGNLFINVIMTNFRIRDWTTGFRAIKTDVVESVTPELIGNTFSGYSWQIGFLVKAIEKGFKVSEVPFVFRDRTYGRSKLGPEYIINNMVFLLKLRITQILENRIFKFVVTGGTGAIVQLTTLQIYRRFFPYQLAFFLAIETAVVSNFILSNLWTFADRKLEAKQIPGKFVAFNLASAGSILIQQALAFLGERFIGLFTLFTLPVIGKPVDTGLMYAVVGIFIGMFWNFFAYSRIIWKAKTGSPKKKSR